MVKKGVGRKREGRQGSNSPSSSSSPSSPLLPSQYQPVYHSGVKGLVTGVSVALVPSMIQIVSVPVV